MKPKEKANELVDRYFNDYGEKQTDGSFMLCVVSIGRAKQCALIAVDEILKLPVAFLDKKLIGGIFKEEEATYEFWEKVKKEINKL